MQEETFTEDEHSVYEKESYPNVSKNSDPLNNKKIINTFENYSQTYFQT